MKRVVLFVVLVMPVMADTQFRTRRMTRNDVPLGKGQCDIRLQIDNEAEVRVHGDMVSVRTFSGREAHDDGSECNEPLPAGPDLQGFNFEVRDSRGEIVLFSRIPRSRTTFRTLEEAKDAMDLPEASGDAIAREFERYFRRHGGGEPGGI